MKPLRGGISGLPHRESKFCLTGYSTLWRGRGQGRQVTTKKSHKTDVLRDLAFV